MDHIILWISGNILLIGVVIILINAIKYKNGDLNFAGWMIIILSIIFGFIVLGCLHGVSNTYDYQPDALIEINKSSVVVILPTEEYKAYTNRFILKNATETDSVFVENRLNSYGYAISTRVRIKINGIYY